MMPIIKATGHMDELIISIKFPVPAGKVSGGRSRTMAIKHTGTRSVTKKAIPATWIGDRFLFFMR
jgi:hypothetical protein